jgi:hypothetical protein
VLVAAPQAVPAELRVARVQAQQVAQRPVRLAQRLARLAQWPREASRRRQQLR